MPEEGTPDTPYRELSLLDEIIDYHKPTRLPPDTFQNAAITDQPNVPLYLLFPEGLWEVGPFMAPYGAILADNTDVPGQLFLGLDVFVVNPALLPRGYKQVIDISFSITVYGSTGEASAVLMAVPAPNGGSTFTTPRELQRGTFTPATLSNYTGESTFLIAAYVDVGAPAHFTGTYHSSSRFVRA